MVGRLLLQSLRRSLYSRDTISCYVYCLLIPGIIKENQEAIPRIRYEGEAPHESNIRRPSRSTTTKIKNQEQKWSPDITSVSLFFLVASITKCERTAVLNYSVK